MSIKCPDSGIQVGSVLPKGIIYWLGLASDANFIRAVAITFGAPIFLSKTKFTYSLLKSWEYFMNKIWGLTNSNDMQIVLLTFYWEKKTSVDDVFWRYYVLMVVQWHILFSSVGGRSHFGAHSPAGHIFIWNSPNNPIVKWCHLRRDVVFSGISFNYIKLA